MNILTGAAIGFATAALLLVPAVAQIRDPNAPTGPYSPHPAQHAPDLRQPAPCEPAANTAGNRAGTPPGTPTTAMQAPEKSRGPSTGALGGTHCPGAGPTSRPVPPPTAAGPHP